MVSAPLGRRALFPKRLARQSSVPPHDAADSCTSSRSVQVAGPWWLVLPGEGPPRRRETFQSDPSNCRSGCTVHDAFLPQRPREDMMNYADSAGVLLLAARFQTYL